MTQSTKNIDAIPEWIIEYDKANYQSSAGKAIRFLIERINQLEKFNDSGLITIYVQQGYPTHGKDSTGKEYYIKHVSNDIEIKV